MENYEENGKTLWKKIVLFLYFTYNNQVSEKLANFQILPDEGGTFHPPPIWGVSNAPKTLIFSQRCAPTQGSNCTIKPKMAKFDHF